MLVRELQEQLSKLDGDLELLCYSEDESLQASGHLFRLLDIDGVDTTEAELVKCDDDVPSFRLGKTDVSKPFAILYVTVQF